MKKLAWCFVLLLVWLLLWTVLRPFMQMPAPGGPGSRWAARMMPMRRQTVPGHGSLLVPEDMDYLLPSDDVLLAMPNPVGRRVRTQPLPCLAVGAPGAPALKGVEAYVPTNWPVRVPVDGLVVEAWEPSRGTDGLLVYRVTTTNQAGTVLQYVVVAPQAYYKYTPRMLARVVNSLEPAAR